MEEAAVEEVVEVPVEEEAEVAGSQLDTPQVLLWSPGSERSAPATGHQRDQNQSQQDLWHNRTSRCRYGNKSFPGASSAREWFTVFKYDAETVAGRALDCPVLAHHSFPIYADVRSRRPPHPRVSVPPLHGFVEVAHHRLPATFDARHVGDPGSHIIPHVRDQGVGGASVDLGQAGGVPQRRTRAACHNRVERVIPSGDRQMVNEVTQS